MLGSKISQDFRIKIQHQNFANNIEFKKKREIGRSVLQCDNQDCQNCNTVNYAKNAKPKQYTLEN
jgi:hypothetical protein